MSARKVSLFLPSLEGGGAERVFVHLANRFAAAGFDVDLVLAAAIGPYLEEVATGVSVVDLGAPGVLRSLPKLVRYLRASAPEVILSGLEHANIVAILACFAARRGTRSVVSIRSVLTAVFRQDRSLRRWFVLQLVKVLYRLTDAIIANSRAAAADLSGPLHVPSEKIRVIYNPLDVGQIRRLSEEANDHPWLVPGARPVVVSVGSLTPRKDFSTLIRAFAVLRRARDCRLIILGEGPERDRLQGLIDELNLQEDASLPGFMPNPFSWIRRSAVFVSSSLTEGCPNALMQSLVCGTPIVSTDCVGGSAEILQEGRWGTLVPVSDAEAMAGAIAVTLDSELIPDLIQRANDFAPDEIVREYLRVLLPDKASTDPCGQD